jgi:hypothetical protein
MKGFLHGLLIAFSVALCLVAWAIVGLIVLVSMSMAV